MNNNFKTIGVSEGLEKQLKKNGILSPTPIQTLTIPKIISGKDILAKAQTGTGKTLAFLLPIFEKTNLDKDYIQGLILTPTRELAIQITEEANKLTQYKNINILAIYGGQDVGRQRKKLNRGMELVIATPGRLLDHIHNNTIDLSKIETLVIDEADEMVNMGFLKDLEVIMGQTPKSRQTLLFSATMPTSLKQITDHMKRPERLVAKEKDILDEQIKEEFIHTTHRQKYKDLCNYLDEHNPFMAIIFCRTKRRVSELTTKLIQDGYNVDELHGDLSQGKRERAMKKFRALETQYLVATDLAARGLDVEGVTHVFNYDETEEDIKHTHRIGRTGRAGEKGIAVTFIVKE